MIRMRLILVPCAALALLAGCGSPQIKPLSSITVSLDGGVKQSTIRTRHAEEVTIQLPPVEQPGYRWQLFSHDSRVLRQTSEIVPPATPGGRATVSFLAINIVPRTLVRFLLVSEANPREADPIDAHDVTVVVR